MMRQLLSFKLAVVVITCAALSGCIPLTDTVADVVSRSSDRVILAGSFEITPRFPQSLNVRQTVMRPAEEVLFGSADDVVGNRLVTGFVPFGTRLRPSVFSTPLSGTIHFVPLDTLNFIEVDRDAIQLRDGKYFPSDKAVDTINIAGGFVTAAHPTAQVVYVGTIRYARDDFFAITDVRVLDRFSQAAQDARRLYGSDITIAKSFWRAPRYP